MVDVESSAVKTIYNLKMSCENLLRIIFTPYPIHSDLGAILPLFDFNDSSARLAIQEFRFTGLASTFSLLVRLFPSLESNVNSVVRTQ